MKIGIISDSHHDLKSLEEAVCLADDVDCWFHAGDSIDDAEYLKQISGKKVYAVCGNIDWFTKAPQEIFTQVEDVNIFLTHGHKYQVKWTLDTLAQRAAKLAADLIIYGHSHVGAKTIIDGRIFLNPGSISQPRDGKPPSFMTAVINGKKIDIQRIFLDKKF